MSVTLLNSNVDVLASSASSFSASMTVNTGGANVAAVARVNVEANTGAPTLGTVTYGGAAMTSVGTPPIATTTSNVALYTLASPATGSNTLAWTVSNGPAASLFADLTAYQGVNQTTPARSGSYNSLSDTTTSTTASLVITSQTGDMTTTVASCADGSSGIASTNQTQRNIDNSGTFSFGTDDAAGAATVTHTWTWSLAVVNHIVAGFSIDGSVGPTINTQPTNQRIYAGQSASFSVSATAASGSLTYQWYKNGGSISGATSSSLTISPNFPNDQTALYYCIVTDSIGSAQTNTVEVIWIFPTFGKVPQTLMSIGDEDYKSELVLLRWF